MKKLALSIITLALMSFVSVAQDISLPLSSVQNGWGWGCAFTYGVTNPNITAGIGCDSTQVTQVALNTNSWAGSFGIADTTGVFAWSSITDWSKYNRIEILIYPDIACSFNDTISYKGWDNINNANISSSIKAIETKQLIPNEWQIVTIDLNASLIDDIDNQKTYASISDMTINVIQLYKLGLSDANGNVFIGGITLKEKTTVITPVIQNIEIPVSAIRNGWGWGCDFTYDVTNPNTTAGVGCDATTVTKIGVSGWAGSFGIADTTGAFAWSSITDWSGYKSIEILIYPDAACTFNNTISYKGWDNNNSVNISSSLPAILTTNFVANEWQILTIDLRIPLVDDVDNQLTYASLADMVINNAQIVNLGLSSEVGNIYIGGITIKNEITTPTEIKEIPSFMQVYPNPASTLVNVSYSVTTDSKITITNLTGIELISQVVSANSDQTPIDVSSLSTGIYIITIPTSEGTASQLLQIK